VKEFLAAFCGVCEVVGFLLFTLYRGWATLIVNVSRDTMAASECVYDGGVSFRLVSSHCIL
jgi:hypothetical protein